MNTTLYAVTFSFKRGAAIPSGDVPAPAARIDISHLARVKELRSRGGVVVINESDDTMTVASANRDVPLRFSRHLLARGRGSIPIQFGEFDPESEAWGLYVIDGSSVSDVKTLDPVQHREVISAVLETLGAPWEPVVQIGEPQDAP